MASRSVARRAMSSAATQTLSVDNPYTGGVSAEVKQLNQSDTLALIDQSATTQRHWSQQDLDTRIRVCQEFLIALEAEKHTIASDVTAMMGKRSRSARSGARCSWSCVRHLRCRAQCGSSLCCLRCVAMFGLC